MGHRETADKTFGIESDGETLRGAWATIHRGKPHISLYSEVPRPEESNVNPLYMDLTKNRRRRYHDSLAVTAIPTEQTLVRPLRVNLTKQRDIAAIFPLEAEPLLPYSIDEGVVDWSSVTKEKEGSLLSVFAVRKEHLTTKISRQQAIGIDAEVVSCVPAALGSFCELLSLNSEPLFVVHLGEEEISCVVVYKGKALGSLSFKPGLSEIVTSLAKEMKTTPKEIIKKLCNPKETSLFEEHRDLWKKTFSQINRVLLSLEKGLLKFGKQKLPAIKNILITGFGADITGVQDSIAKFSERNLLTPKTPRGLGVKSVDLPRFAVALGLAVSALRGQEHPLNFRQGSFANPHPWRRLGRPLGLFFITITLLCSLFFGVGKLWCLRETTTLRQQYVSLLATNEYTATSFEKEFRETMGKSLEVVEAGLFTVNRLSGSDIAARLDFLEKKLGKTTSAFPLLPRVPKVSDVLAWLTSLPGIGDISNTSKQKVTIESFSYSMVSRPEKSRKKEKYRAKVEIDFSTATPSDARAIHNALITPNPFIDPKGDVKWTTSQGRYRASFFLKDKTPYKKEG